MSEIIELQSELRSQMDRDKVCTFNMEVIDGPTSPLIHQEARFWLINKGDATAVINGRTTHLTQGSLVSVLPWEITEIVDVKVPLQYYIIVYHFDSVSMLMKSMCGDLNNAPEIFEEMRRSPAVICKKHQYSKVRDLFLELKDELGTEDTLQTVTPQKLSYVYVTNKVIAVILEFFRAKGTGFEESDRKEFSKEEILQYIYTHLNEDITAKSLSKIFYLSENTVSRYVKQLTGLSVGELCNEMRIVRVSNYLLYTDLTVAELSDIVGYSDASHLSRLFKARMGVKINEFRKTYSRVGKICAIDETKEVYNLINYIYRHHTDDINISVVSEEFQLSAVSINRMLLCQVEKNFNDFLNYIRINHACKLLLTTDKSILTVAVDVGYNNAKTFTRNFLKFKVMMPAEFKRRAWLQKASLSESLFPFE